MLRASPSWSRPDHYLLRSLPDLAFPRSLHTTMEPNTLTFYDLNDAERAVLPAADVAQIYAVHAK
ncbi:BZ3500_MvSof-1268-A1-R1_Chr3-1g05619 [Microbotryum saponariae]|uniref:BZ3500_MvSof-1268-A1-R1_Chr3-1g05619 protein n=1 Tax=Microbotryum saponariae TaxID=289078 RepID=A0A2X0LG39_9BASI|nr:BZ3500_MvSof-1268-A1-R1_Chr3-1g05619 [Microbotryum saponariae]SDA04809.1 BZ3501_MvSof-1269-A2-R1_Chr3-1g05289 [Microbotryum saponariae]